MNKMLKFKSQGWDDYLYWQTQDKKTLKKINKLLDDLERTCICFKVPFSVGATLRGRPQIYTRVGFLSGQPHRVAPTY